MLDFNWNWRKENCDFAPASVRPTTTATNWHQWNEFDRESWVISAGLTWRHQSTLFYYAIAVADWSSIWRDPLMWYAANDKIAPNFIIDDNILRDCTWHRNKVIFQRSNRLNSPGGSPSFLSRIFFVWNFLSVASPPVEKHFRTFSETNIWFTSHVTTHITTIQIRSSSSLLNKFTSRVAYTVTDLM